MLSTKERITGVIVKTLNVPANRLIPTAHFIKDLGADSLDMVELVIELENEFGITVPDEHIERFETLQHVSTYIENALKTQVRLAEVEL